MTKEEYLSKLNAKDEAEALAKQKEYEANFNQICTEVEACDKFTTVYDNTTKQTIKAGCSSLEVPIVEANYLAIELGKKYNFLYFFIPMEIHSKYSVMWELKEERDLRVANFKANEEMKLSKKQKRGLLISNIVITLGIVAAAVAGAIIVALLAK